MRLIDLNFLGLPNTIGSYLLESGKHKILVETGPASILPTFKQKLASINLSIEQITDVFLTHIHLDHSGGAWAFANEMAQIYVHPRGVQHLVNPEKLIASASMIYGDQMDRLWGEINGIDIQKVRGVENQEAIKLNDLVFKAHHTPGHANHHIVWSINDLVFTGDVAGVKMVKNGPVIPPCPPPDIDIPLWLKSIETIRILRPKKLCLTHFGVISDWKNHLDELEERLLKWEQWLRPFAENNESIKTITPKFIQMVMKSYQEKNLSKTEIDYYEKANPSYMSVLGLMRYIKQTMK
jgi:glyoxylase-like metal-dependent hydrolase (beta-lactamase superfamily II)